MRKSVLASSVLLLAFSVANAGAADENEVLKKKIKPAYVVAAPMASKSTPYNWSGFYVGAQGGWVGTRDRYSEIDLLGVWDTTRSTSNNNSAVGGVFAGYNHQINNIVLGIELDAEATNIKNKYDNTIDGWSAKTGINWQGSARARLGYAFDRLLVYVSGGVTLARLTAKYSDYIDDSATLGYADIVGTEKFVSNKVGWTIGTGTEYALTTNVIARLDYRYTEYGITRNIPVVIWTDLEDKHHITSHSIRAGLSYKF